MLIVKKFGGSSVADAGKIYNVANRCIEDYKKGNKVVVVLSAMGKTTDGLIAKAHEISAAPNKREMDMLLTTGEQISVSLMAMAMAELGVPAVSLNAFQVQMHTSSAYGTARLRRIDTERINHELDSGRIVVVTGFQGVNKRDDYTTLGRGGSDTTAVALAAALHADACEIYTDVDGVFTADPRIVPNARKLDEVTYDEMLEMASQGAKVLHNRSVEIAKKYNVKMIVRSSFNHSEGTVVKEKTKVEGTIISGVAADKNVARVAIIAVKDEPGVAFKVFHSLSSKNICVDNILQSIGREGTKDITFTVNRTVLQEVLDILNQAKDEGIFHCDGISSNDKIAKVSIIGAGVQSNAGVATKMFEALYAAGINIKMISTSEIRITVLIDEADVNRAMRAVHDAFELGD